ncbi:MAG: phosphoribosylglycinamide formyltransferase [Pseudomonadota bacterium]
MTSSRFSLAILGSTRGTTMLYLLNAISANTLKAKINVVISDKENAYILQRAKANKIPAHFVSPKGLSRCDYDTKITALLQQQSIDLIVLIGYMRILSTEFVRQWHHKIINIHPSLLPRHAGLMDKAVHQAVLDSQDKKTGCSVHYVTETVDGGPIIMQKCCQVADHDTVDSLKAKVAWLEGKAYIESINHFAKNRKIT